MHHPSYFEDQSSTTTTISTGQAHNLGRARSYINPHAPKRKQDPTSNYIIGDVYERSEGLKKGLFAKDGERDGPYLRYLKKLSRNGWPNLLYLAEFIETSTVPIKKRLLSKEDFQERYSRTDVTILDYHKTTGLVTRQITSARELSEAVKPSKWKDVPGSTRLIISTDLSSTTIETLGAAYEIDPRLFRSYLTDYQWFHVKDPWYTSSPFESDLKEDPFLFSQVYPRLFYLPNKPSVDKIEIHAGRFNVQRAVLTDPGEARVGNLRSTMGFWCRPDEWEKGCLGILLLDPDVPDAKPLWADFHNYTAPPSMKDPISSKTGHESIIENFIASAHTLIAENGGSGVHAIDFLTIHLRTIAIHWSIFLSHAETRLSIIEWALQPRTLKTARSLEETLQQVHPWRRRIPLYRKLLSKILTVLAHQISLSPHSKVWAALQMDFLDLEHQRSLLEARVDRITSTMTAIIAIDENKKAMKSANDVARITYLAFVFVPLSFLTGVFSMDRGFPEGGTMVYWVFAVLAVPVAGIPLVLAMNWERVRGWWMGIIGGNGKV